MDVGAAIRADTPAGTTQIVLFVPSKDRAGGPSIKTGGSTSGWPHSDACSGEQRPFLRAEASGETTIRGGALLEEMNRARGELRHFLCRFGRQAHQGEVGVAIDGTYYGFTKFEEG